ncbi:hypothetical protein V6C27_03155 [Peptococcaceae bacterium 1198_IL3148]
MELSKKVEQTLTKALVLIGKKADEVTELANLKYSCYQLKKQRNALLRDLGSYVYKANLINPTTNEKAAKYVEEIKFLDAEIKKLNHKIAHR